ncbi:hypothetical protein [Halapricum salinum]|uniref:Uncharacterized protein n=1 Tax=Halapricum salinum TaxID=1457250 RepID=A0A4D6HCX4_9EURY|nr:hypothetical protein [Halapricum salinum]QCC51660.1 hypothetical protein DV733_10620 [Halapricum salinum]
MVHYPRQMDDHGDTWYRLLGYAGVVGVLLALVLTAGVVLLTAPLPTAPSSPIVATLVFTVMTVVVALIARRLGTRIRE